MSVVWLTEIGKGDIARAGGKAANLGELTRLGLCVPAGFCITTDDYVGQVEAWALTAALAPALRAQDWSRASAIATDLLLEGAIAPALLTEWVDAYRRLGAGPVAVRSSATAEDLRDASFAGQQESFLHVQGEEALIDAVRRCWASLWGARALHYRHYRGIAQSQVQMAVVVQQMVPADLAGVLFTVDPTGRERGQMVIEAVPGLGEAVVSGLATGDLYRLDRLSLAILDRTLRNACEPVLTDEQLTHLGQAGLRLELHFGCPQDVEFACAGGRLYFLQSRPITTLSSAEPEPVAALGHLSLFQSIATARFRERYPLAPQPLDNLAVTVIIRGSANALRRLGLWCSERSVDALCNQRWRAGLTLPNPWPTLRLLAAPVRMVRLWNRDLLTWWQGEPHRKLVEVSRVEPLQPLTDAALCDRADRIYACWLAVISERLVITFSIYVANALLHLLVALALGRRRAGASMGDLISGLYTRTTAVNQALWQLALEARQIPAVQSAIAQGDMRALQAMAEAAPFCRALDAFLDAYGHREGTTWYLSTPTWRQEPGQVLALLQGLLQIDQLPANAGLQRYAATHQAVMRGLRRYIGLPTLFGWLVERYRRLHLFEEESHFDLTRPLDALQAVAIEWGRRLCARGLLADARDLYLLNPAEVRAWLLGSAPSADAAQEIIARRRATYGVASGRWAANRFDLAPSGSELRGVGASRGVASGVARIVRGEHEFGRVKRGEILVCPHTIPSWTPLFATVAAVVTEVGGVASHAAIVAREYGIPAVMGIAGATQRIQDGQELLVDGDTGTVVLGAPAHSGDAHAVRDGAR